jgi:hypothetical protein
MERSFDIVSHKKPGEDGKEKHDREDERKNDGRQILQHGRSFKASVVSTDE